MKWSPLSVAIGLSALASTVSSATAQCPPPLTGIVYDYIVVGSGTGGGPVASRLALAGYSVLLVDAGLDIQNVNSTIPLYSPRTNEDPNIVLDYEVDLYAPGSPQMVKNWYPRAAMLGGSGAHNALVSITGTKYDFDTLSTTLNDPSWAESNMRKYFVKLENNLYMNQSQGAPLGHGYGGWLYTDNPPTDIVTDPKWYDPQLIDVVTGIQSLYTTAPSADFNIIGNDLFEGGGQLTLTKNPAHNRSSVRDFVADTLRQTRTLNFLPLTMVTKILTCGSGSGVTAYGITAAFGRNLLPASRMFTGKRKLTTANMYARYEVILSAGTYQTPHILMLSGIGDPVQLQQFNIPTVVSSPGVGKNLMDRVETSVVYDTKADWVLFKGCKFGDSVDTDPCLKEWSTNGHHNLYSAGPGFWASRHKSDPNLPYLDIWTHWAPARFQGYYRGYPNDVANDPHALSVIILKGHTKSKGWVKLTGSDPQDSLEINKNLYATPDSLNDLYAVREAVKLARKQITSTSLINNHVLAEKWPGPNVQTDAQIEQWIRTSAWGHHACCTAKMGRDSDPTAVLDNNFKVRGVRNLRVVDVSIFPEIPAFFITTPMYMASEKAADVILAQARANGWLPN